MHSIFTSECIQMFLFPRLKVHFGMVLVICVLLTSFCFWMICFERTASDFINNVQIIPTSKTNLDDLSYINFVNEPYFHFGEFCSVIEDFIGYSSIVEFGADLGLNGRCWLRSFENLLNTNMDNYKNFYYAFTRQMKEAKLIDKVQVIQTWEGYERVSNIDHVTNGWVKYLDLLHDINLGKKFDWVISLKGPKDISKEEEDVYIDNLVNHAKEGIILSRPVITHGEEIKTVSKLKQRHWYQDTYSENLLRNKIDDENLKKTLMVFRKNK